MIFKNFLSRKPIIPEEWESFSFEELLKHLVSIYGKFTLLHYYNNTSTWICHAKIEANDNNSFEIRSELKNIRDCVCDCMDKVITIKKTFK